MAWPILEGLIFGNKTSVTYEKAINMGEGNKTHHTFSEDKATVASYY